MFIVFISFRRQFGAPEVFFPSAQLAPETAWPPSRHVDLPLFFLSCPPLSFIFFCLFPFFSSFFFLSLSLFIFLSLFLSFWGPFCDPGGPRPPKPLKIRPCLYGLFIHSSPYASYFSLSSLLKSFNLHYRKLKDAVY